MPTKLELLQAIADLQSREPTYNTCEKLATFYTLLSVLYSDDQENVRSVTMNIFPDTVGEFGEVISGKQIDKVIDVLNEHFEVVKVLFPKEYDAVISRISEIQ